MCNESEVVHAVLDIVDDGEFIPVMLFAVGGVVSILWTIAWSFTTVLTTRSKEATKREIAAYVAEGMLDPDQAVAMLNAGEKVKV